MAAGQDRNAREYNKATSPYALAAVAATQKPSSAVAAPVIAVLLERLESLEDDVPSGPYYYKHISVPPVATHVPAQERSVWLYCTTVAHCQCFGVWF
jgi:hypothetical protein